MAGEEKERPAGNGMPGLEALRGMLEGSEEITRALFEGISQIAFAKDRRGVYTLANPAFSRAFSLPIERIIGKTDAELFTKSEAAKLRKIDRRVLGGETVRSEDRLTIKGEERVFATIKFPLRDKQGDIVGLWGFASDITREKGFEESLQRSETLLKSVFDSIQDGISVLDADLTIRFVNHKMNEWYEQNTPLEGKKCFAAYHNRTQPCAPCPSLRAIHSGRVERDIVPGITGSSAEWIELFSYPMRDPASGAISGVVEFVRDITAQVRREEEIAHLNGLLRTVRNINQLIAKEKDRDRLLQGACELLIETRGYQSAWVALLDKKGEIYAFFHAGLGDKSRPLEAAFKGGKLLECARRALERPGIVLIEDPGPECRDCPLLRDASEHRELTARLEYGGKVYGLISVSAPEEYAGMEEERSLLAELAGDISFALHALEAEEASERDREALQASEEQYRSIVENSHAGILIVDEGYRFLYVNDRLCRILNRSRDEIIGHDFREFLDEESRDLVAARYRRRQAGEKVSPRYEFNVLQKDGTKRRVEISSTILRQADGKVRTVAQILDITERTQLQERLDAIDELTRTLILLRDKDAIIKHTIDAVKSLIGMADCAAYLTV